MRIFEGILTDTFNQMIDDLCSKGWKVTYEYDGMDAWIDYGKVLTEKEGQILTWEWDNWSEGSVEGDESLILRLKEKYVLKDLPALPYFSGIKE